MSEYFVGSTGANNQTNFSSLDTSEVLDDLGLNTGDAPTFSGLFINSTGTGANNTLFSVDGSNGRLFGVTDEVTGTVFSVNDAAGLPIVEVESTSNYDKITLGEYGSDLLVLSGQTTAEVTGSQIATQSWISDQGFSAGTNYYLTGVSKSGNTFTFEVNGASDPTYTLTSGDITGALGYTPVTLEDDGSIEAEEFIGDLRGAVSFKAQAGEAIAKGEAVFISGISGNTTVVALADANDATKMPAFGIASEAASANNPVTVINFGSLGSLDTDTPNWDEGDELFVSNTAGELTTTPPTSESSLLQKIAKVTRRHASSGSITVMGAGRTNAVPNLNEGRLFVGNSSNQAVADDTAYVDIANSRVGIGTTSPAGVLEVAGNTDTNSNFLVIRDKDPTAGSARPSIRFAKLDGTVLGQLLALDGTNQRLQFSGNNTEDPHLTVYNNGNVGIGETAPEVKLEVAGDIQAKDSGVLAGANGAKDGFIFHDLYTSAGNYYGYKAFTSPTRLSIVTNGIEGLTIDANSNVGIGVGGTNPDARLRLKGAGGSSGLTFKTTDFSNNETFYVFDGGRAGVRYSPFSIGIPSTTSVATNAVFQVEEAGLLTVLSTGNVGIGTTSPSELLEVSSNTGAADGTTNPTTIRISDTDNGSAWDTTNSFANLDFYSADSSGSGAGTKARVGAIAENSTGAQIGLAFSTTNSTDDISEKLRIDASGNVGIGTTSPAHKLHIASGTTNVGIQTISTDAGAYMGFEDNSTGNTGSNSNVLVGANGNNFVAFTNATERLRIDSSGNVGVGATSPVSKLHVYQNDAATSTTAGITIEQDGTGDAQLQFLLSSAYRWVQGIDNSDGDKFKIGRGNAWSIGEDVTITTSGEVGIGDTTPSYKLDVAGDIRATGDLRADDDVFIAGNTLRFTNDAAAAHIQSVDTLYIEADANINDTGGKPIIFRTAGTTKMTIAGGGDVTIDNDLTVSGNLTVNGTTSTINSTTLQVDDKNIELGTVATPTDTTADGGGITLKGATDKTINWVNSTGAWTFSEKVSVPADGSVFGGSGGVPIYVRSTGTVSYIQIQNSSTGGSGSSDGLTVGCNGNAGYLWLREAANLNIGTNDTTAITINSSQNTTFAGSVTATSLDINGAADISGNLEVGEYILRSGQGSNYHRFLDNRQIFVVGNSSSIVLNNGTSTFGATGGATTLQGSSLSFTGNATFAGSVNISTPASITPNSSASELVVGSGVGNQGITIYSGDTNSGSIHFADDLDEEGAGDNPAGNRDGVIIYSHSANNFNFKTAGNQQALALSNSTATFAGSVTATSLIKSGGSSSEFLKADGSVDSNTYLTTSSASSTYLPLAGGTLSGGLTLNGDVTFGGTAKKVIINSKRNVSLPAIGTKMRILTLSDNTFIKVFIISSENSYVEPIELDIHYKSAGGASPVIHRVNNYTWHVHSNDIAFSSDSSGHVYMEKLSYTTGRNVKIHIVEQYQGSASLLDGSTTTTTNTGSDESNIGKFGTITAGTWNGGVIASAYLDADTAHLSGTQTFTGAKTFGDITSSGGYKANIAESSDADNITSNNIKYGYLANAASNKPVSGNSQYASVGNITLTHYDAASVDDFYIRAKAYNGNTSWAKIFTNQNSSGITTVGTIGTGTWQGSVIASAYLDTDTAHLSGTQTFSGAKTFSSGLNISVSTSNTQLKLKRTGTATGEFNIYTNNDTLFFNNVGQSSFPMVIDGDGNVGIGTTSFVDTRATGGLHLANAKGIAFQSTSSNTNSRAWRIRNDDLADWGSLNFAVGTTNSDFADAATDVVMTMLRSGNVGIGTTAPAAKLHVYNSGGGDATDKAGMLSEAVMKLQPHASNSTNMLFAQVNNGSGMGIQVTNGPATANWDIALSPFGGNVGIGTTSPSYLLDLESTATGLTHNLKLNKSSTTGDYAEIAFQLWSGAGTGLNTFGGSGTSRPSVVLRAINENGSQAAGAFAIATFTGGATNSTLTEKFRLTSAGNVGIGTNSPSSKLQIDQYTVGSNGNQNTFGNVSIFTNSGSDALYLGVKNASYPNRGYSFKITESGVNSDFTIKEHGLSDDRFTIKSGGNVGIGTTSPSSKLHVAGDIKTSTRFFAQTGTSGEDFLMGFWDAANARIESGAALPMLITSYQGNIKLGINGGTTMTVKSTAVGIGTTDPNDILEVKSSMSIIDSNGTNAHCQLFSNASEGVLRIHNGANWGLIARGQSNNPYLGAYYGGSLNIVGFGSSDGATIDDQLAVFDFGNSQFKLYDSKQLVIGDGADLRLFHNGSHSYIHNDTGDLNIENDTTDGDIIFKSDDGSGGLATYFRVDGGSTNVQFFKDVFLPDNTYLNIGGSFDLRLFHDTSNSYIQAQGTGDLIIQQTVDDKDIIFKSDNGSGGITEYLRLDGGTTTLQAYKDLLIANDTAKIKLGASQDLQIYHNGSHSYIQDSGTGVLKLLGSGVTIQNAVGSENMLVATENGSVDLYYDSNKKLETTTSGIYVSGNITASGGGAAPSSPASASAAIVGNTVEVTFAASTTSNIDAYLVYSSIDGSDYGLISVVPPDDFAASMSIIDNAFDETGTQAYRVYAMKLGKLSSAQTTSVSYTVSSAEPTTMSVVNLNNAYYVQWNPPSSNARFVTAYNVYKHEHATQASLSRSSASLVYSGMNTNYMYQISGTNNNNFHQFWVETTIA